MTVRCILSLANSMRVCLQVMQYLLLHGHTGTAYLCTVSLCLQWYNGALNRDQTNNRLILPTVGMRGISVLNHRL